MPRCASGILGPADPLGRLWYWSITGTTHEWIPEVGETIIVLMVGTTSALGWISAVTLFLTFFPNAGLQMLARRPPRAGCSLGVLGWAPRRLDPAFRVFRHFAGGLDVEHVESRFAKRRPAGISRDIGAAGIGAGAAGQLRGFSTHHTEGPSGCSLPVR